jgi:hypothetical protein
MIAQGGAQKKTRTKGCGLKPPYEEVEETGASLRAVSLRCNKKPYKKMRQNSFFEKSVDICAVNINHHQNDDSLVRRDIRLSFDRIAAAPGG